MDKKVVMTEQEGIDALMNILEGVQTKTAAPLVSVKKDAPAAPKETVYEHGMVIVKDGKKTTVGPKKSTGRKGGSAKEDKGREELKAIYTKTIADSPIYGPGHFIHSSEGVIVRMLEADYSIKVSKSKEKKYDPTEEDFEVEKDFSVRGKAKNTAPAIAKAILAALESPDTGVDFTLISAKASGIIVHYLDGEYTIKISKKRERVGFEAEKGAAYEG